MRGSIGLVIGLALGAGAMYLVLRPPWGPRAATVPSEGPPVVVVGSDAGVTKPVRKRRGPRPAGAPAAQPDEIDDAEPVALTVADRALDWRGDDVALPAQTIDLAVAREARPLDDGEIRATIEGQTGVKDCVVQGATGTDLRATITIKLVVDGRGKVTRSRVQAPRYLLDHGLYACTRRAVARMHFPATGGPTLVTLPVILEPTR